MALGRKGTESVPNALGARSANGAVPGQINMIGEGTVLDGTLRAEGDVRISGRVEGRVEVVGKVIVAQEGTIEGELKAVSADIAGRVDGHINVSERVVLKGTARIEGDIQTARLVVEEGAIFAGKCLMESKTKSASSPPAPVKVPGGEIAS